MPLTPTDGFSATTSSTPTFFWYVPPTIARTAEFSLLDGKDKPLYKTTFNLTSEGGIVGFTLPESVTSSMVEPGKDYYWQFSVLCDPNQPSKNPFVEGVVQRVQPDSTLLAQLQSASPRERATIYATSGIWQDAIATLAQQRCVNPKTNPLKVAGLICFSLFVWQNLHRSLSHRPVQLSVQNRKFLPSLQLGQK